MQKLLFAYVNACLITPHLAFSGESYKHHITHKTFQIQSLNFLIINIPFFEQVKEKEANKKYINNNTYYGVKQYLWELL